MKNVTAKVSLKNTMMAGIGLVLLLALMSLVFTVAIYRSQFPRVTRPDETVTASLRYTDLSEKYPRVLFYFVSGANRLHGYLYHQDAPLGLVVVAHGLGEIGRAHV